jgi:hypothetical protein
MQYIYILFRRLNYLEFRASISCNSPFTTLYFTVICLLDKAPRCRFQHALVSFVNEESFLQESKLVRKLSEPLIFFFLAN